MRNAEWGMRNEECGMQDDTMRREAFHPDAWPSSVILLVVVVRSCFKSAVSAEDLLAGIVIAGDPDRPPAALAPGPIFQAPAPACVQSFPDKSLHAPTSTKVEATRTMYPMFTHNAGRFGLTNQLPAPSQATPEGQALFWCSAPRLFRRRLSVACH